MSRLMMNRRFQQLPPKATLALSVLMVLLGLLVLTLLETIGHSRTSQSTADSELVRELGLTDLSLFTEARYTRHPSQADRHTPFQDHPAALEHFPSSVFVPPPLIRAPDQP